MFSTPPLHLPEWDTYRIIPSHYPPIDLFERIYDPEEFELAFEIEGMTNPRLRDQVGDIELVRPDDRVSGPGSTPVMASFTHLGFGSRFADRHFGVYYAASSLDAAIRETVYHKEREMAAANEDSIALTMRAYIGSVALDMHDIRGPEFADLHNPDADDYVLSQKFASRWRTKGSNGLLYNSVRCPGSECIAAFKPRAVSIPVQGPHLKYFWDGDKQRITHWAEIGEAHVLSGH
ncbi:MULTISPECIES: RES family NAD+ phosphorylase [unclassified Marinobacter]|uniref:RES family NAD+ phosphorylase n=1 Tax=unclassified Marinobacter TaxID=83889 RepID=UPI0026E34357|nr:MULTISPECIES: RES family NAD+ phosphorylase [unclassified Marinobacter]MDO6442275.1 RES family NAD+ phosphorylase [Marinobacter sp. 2_MG-2023]MDO6824955.1 RES family NAD+ phosphorylase [Marinobacter sp. 1_MG-2023]